MPIRQLRRDRPRRLELDAVALAVVDRQRDDRKTALARQRGANHRFEPAGQKDDCGFHGAPSKASAPTKEGPRALAGQRPRYRANTPDWEESVPNPAHNPFTMQWLNGALMARRGLVRGAIADPPRLRDIMERQVVRDALRVDPQRTRRDHAKLCPAETAAGAAIIDRRSSLARRGSRAARNSRCDARTGRAQ